jgi:hypothetical protein
VTYSVAGESGRLAGAERGRNALALAIFLLAAAAFLLRFTISPEVLDRFENYTGDSGSFVQKLHIGTYAILLVLPLALFSRPFVLRGDEIGKFKALLRYLGLLVALMLYLGLVGHFSTSGFLIDTYLSAGAAGLIMMTQSEDARRRLGDIIVLMLVVSALMGIFEAVTHHRILPYDNVEAVFRPIGLTEHPLALGTLCAAGIGFAASTHWRIWLRVAACFVLLIGCAVSGARFALLTAAVEVLLLLLLTPWPRLSRQHARQAKAIVLLLVLVGGAGLVALLAAAGLLSRFGDGVFDANAMVRLSIYDIFNFVSWQSLLFGMPANALIDVVQKQLHLPTLESAPIAIIMLFGLPMALSFAGLLAWIVLRLLRFASAATSIATLTFFVAALSNNALSTKTPAFAIALVLVLAYSNRAPKTVQPSAGRG